MMLHEMLLLAVNEQLREHGLYVESMVIESEQNICSEVAGYDEKNLIKEIRIYPKSIEN